MSCTYCRRTLDIQRHHVIPCSYLGYRSYDNLANLIPVCGECNNFISDLIFKSDDDLRFHLIKKYKHKYKKALNLPNWSHEELNELSQTFQESIKSLEALKQAINDLILVLIPEVV